MMSVHNNDQVTDKDLKEVMMSEATKLAEKLGQPDQADLLWQDEEIRRLLREKALKTQAENLFLKSAKLKLLEELGVAESENSGEAEPEVFLKEKEKEPEVQKRKDLTPEKPEVMIVRNPELRFEQPDFPTEESDEDRVKFKLREIRAEYPNNSLPEAYWKSADRYVWMALRGTMIGVKKRVEEEEYRFFGYDDYGSFIDKASNEGWNVRISDLLTIINTVLYRAFGFVKADFPNPDNHASPAHFELVHKINESSGWPWLPRNTDSKIGNEKRKIEPALSKVDLEKRQQEKAKQEEWKAEADLLLKKVFGDEVSRQKITKKLFEKGYQKSCPEKTPKQALTDKAINRQIFVMKENKVGELQSEEDLDPQAKDYAKCVDMSPEDLLQAVNEQLTIEEEHRKREQIKRSKANFGVMIQSGKK